ncbi:pentapeptide repeat-containing protein [Nocardioides sp. MAHUQ-72]|uniref:pentapeptide repeat-containing protein n=1 Tax=unclassified Nocardioides TaxID=2615069 RepID=UPI003609E4A5
MSWEEQRALLERLVAALERDVEERAKPKGAWERWATPATVVVGALAVCATVWGAQRQVSSSSDQFEQTVRQQQYSDIVDGLASTSVGVQVNSIRRLVHYVDEPENFDSAGMQQEAEVNAAQTLTAFIEDESTVPGHDGLTSFRDPQPVVVSRAMTQLMELTGRQQDGDVEVPAIAVDVSRGNFHGVAISDFRPEGSFRAVAADFRGAAVAGWDLTHAPQAPDLRNAMFTCADLQTSNLGTADVSGTDFTGANLRGADLSMVQHLTSNQLAGVLTGPETRLPPQVDPPPGPAWGVRTRGEHFVASPACRFLMDRMTNLVPGAGFSSRLPCPAAAPSRWPVRLSPPEHAALDRVCRLRQHREDHRHRS